MEGGGAPELGHGSGGRTEWKEAACDRSLVEKLNGEATSFSGKRMGREEARGLRKKSFRSRVVWGNFWRVVAELGE